MIVWADGGWDFHRCIGYASVHREGFDSDPIVQPVLRPVSTSLLCEYEALVLAVCLTPDDSSVTIYTDSQTAVSQLAGDTDCSVLELAPYLSWLRRHLGARVLEWASREGNLAHVPMSRVFAPEDSWSTYELEALRKRRRS